MEKINGLHNFQGNKPMVSVIIPTYNCAYYVSKAINSVLNQTYKNYEIIIIDDGSVDNTKIIIEQYLMYPNVHYIYQKNKGLAAARNTGIRNSTGEYIALLDADDYWSSQKLEKQMEIFESNPDITLVHSNMYLLNENDDKNFKKYSMNLNYNGLSSNMLFKKLLFWEADILAPTIVIKKIAFERIGYFDENLSYIGCEDREFCLRVTRVFKTFFLDEYLAYYMIRSNSMCRDEIKMQKARAYVIQKTVNETPHFKNKKRVKEIIYSKLHFRIALNYFKERELKEALKNFLISLKYDFFNLKTYIFILVCLLPMRFINLIKYFKKIFEV